MAPPLSARTGRLRMFDGSRPFEKPALEANLQSGRWRFAQGNGLPTNRIHPAFSQAVGLGFFVRRCSSGALFKSAGVRRRPRRWRVSDRLSELRGALGSASVRAFLGDGQICTGVSVSFSLVIIGDN